MTDALNYLLLTRPDVMGNSPELLASALDREIGLDTSGGADFTQYVVKAAICGTLHAMRPALQEFAQRAMSEGSVTLQDGLTEFRFLGDAGCGHGRFLLSSSESRSAFGFDLKFVPVVKPEVKAQLDLAHAVCEAERQTLGMNLQSYTIRGIMGPKTKAQLDRAALLKDPASYLAVQASGDLSHLSAVLVAAGPGEPAGLCRGGLPEDCISTSEAVSLGSLSIALRDKTSRALLLDSFSLEDPSAGRQQFVPVFNTRPGLMRGLMMLTDAISTEPALREQVTARARDIFSKPWRCMLADSPIAEELGLSIVAESCGLMTPFASGKLDNVHLSALARCIKNMMPRILTACEALREHGHVSSNASYSCNDLRDEAWAPQLGDEHLINARSSGRQWAMQIKGDPGSRFVTLLAGSAEQIRLEMHENGGELEVHNVVWERPNHAQLLKQALDGLDSITLCVSSDYPAPERKSDECAFEP